MAQKNLDKKLEEENKALKQALDSSIEFSNWLQRELVDKIKDLKSLKKETEVSTLKEEVKRIKEENRDIINFFFSRTTDSPNLSISGEVSSLSREFLLFRKKLEEKIKERIELEKQIVSKDKQVKNENLSPEEREKLEVQIVELRRLLEETNKKIEEWEKKIRGVEERLKDYYEGLKSSIEEKQSKLERLKSKLAGEVMDKSKNESLLRKTGTVATNLYHGKITDKSYGERLEKFLESYLERAIRYTKDEMVQKEKDEKFEKLRKRTPSELFGELVTVCHLKQELVELKIQLEDAEKVTKVFNKIEKQINISESSLSGQVNFADDVQMIQNKEEKNNMKKQEKNPFGIFKKKKLTENKIDRQLEENNKNNMTDNKNNSKQITNKQPSVNLENVDTKEGNANVGNTAGDNANLGYENKGRIMNIRDNRMEGQNIFGDHNTATQNTAREKTLGELKDDIERRLDRNGKKLFRKIIADVGKHLREDSYWREDEELGDNILDLEENYKISSKELEVIWKILEVEAKVERERKAQQIQN